MKQAGHRAVAVFLSLLLAGVAPAWSQTKPSEADLTNLMIRGYDLLQEGKLDQAQATYNRVLQSDPSNPLALNNLGAIMVKRGNYKKALDYLKQAKAQAKGHRVFVSRLCDVNGVCLALRPSSDPFGGEEIEPLIDFNISMLKLMVAH